MEQLHGTTILSVRRGASVALGGDGQVTLGNVVLKAAREGAPPLPGSHPRRLRRRHRGCIHAVRALRSEARQAPGQPDALGGGAGEGLAHRPCAAAPGGDARGHGQGAPADHHRHGRRARARARHARRSARAASTRKRRRARWSTTSNLAPREIVDKALAIAGDICIYTNQQRSIEVLE